MITIDFETQAINRRPGYPPEPVGVAIKYPGRPAAYLAWGHPDGNNASREDGRREVKKAYDAGEDLCFYNGKFDVEVARGKFGLEVPAWQRIHDPMFQVFLADPYAASFALKPSAERLLHLPPDEQDEVRDWLIDHRIVAKNDKHWGAHICDAPGDLVGKYACGDVDRTEKLHKLLFPQIRRDGMLPAYNRERELMPILLENERHGMRVDLELLKSDVQLYTRALADADAWLRKRLKTKDMNVDSAEELANALEKCGVVTEFKLTEAGNRSLAKDVLTWDLFKDREVFNVYGYRQKLATCLSTFINPWLAQALEAGGRIHTNWSQIKQTSAGGDDTGAKTGRLSSSPNFQNIPKEFMTGDDALGWHYPKKIKLPPLPLIRSYVLPDKGEIFFHRDYAQQEIRILAHYESGDLMDAFNMAVPPPEMCDKKGRLDIHEYVRINIEEQTGMVLSRARIKTLNFGMLYGMGLAKLAKQLNVDEATAKLIRNAQRRVLAGMKDLDKELKRLGSIGSYMRTWGGRIYYQEPSKMVGQKKVNGVLTGGKRRDFGYKLLNYEIQGSAGDVTKQALINYHNHPKRTAHVIVNVHDEINGSSKPAHLKRNLLALKEAMLDVKLDVPMISDAKTGDRWSTLKPYKD